jgi:hypothetical protein
MPSQTTELPAQSSIRNGESSNFPVFPQARQTAMFKLFCCKRRFGHLVAVEAAIVVHRLKAQGNVARMADEPVLGEPVSGQIPCYQGKNREFRNNR